MRLILICIIAATMAVSTESWILFNKAKSLNRQIHTTQAELVSLNLEGKRLAAYKNDIPVTLSRLYLDLFKNVEEICGYYQFPCTVKISGGRDLSDIKQFFQESQYPGIKFVEVLCQVNFRDPNNLYLTNLFYRMAEHRPIEFNEIRIEGNSLTLKMRLLGI